MVEACCYAFEDHSEFRQMQSMCSADELLGHLPVMFGFICTTLQIDVHTTVQCFMYSTLRNLLAAIVRAGKIGPLQVQEFEISF